MAKKKNIVIQFPFAGLNRKTGYQFQPPYSSPDCLNVRPVDSWDRRERGSTRSGLLKSHIDSLGGAVRLLSPMILNLGDNFTTWSDTFGGNTLASDLWTQAAWVSAMPSILPPAYASIDTSVDEGAVVLSSLPIDSSETYSVEMFIMPWKGSWHGYYRLYLRLDNDTPDIETDGVMVELYMDDNTGDYSGILRTVLSEVTTDYVFSGSLDGVQAGWLIVSVSGDTITVYWGSAEVISHTVDIHSGLRAGFGLECVNDGGLCLANVFRIQYYSTETVSALRSILIASAGGNLHKEGPYCRITEVISDLTVRDDVSLQAVQSGQKLIIADYGDVVAEGTGTVNGTTLDDEGVDFSDVLDNDMVVYIYNPQGTAVAGTYKISSHTSGDVTLASSASSNLSACDYRIERAPKVYDPSNNTIEILTATAGQVPTGCPIIWRCMGRIFLAGAAIAPHVWYACRPDDPTDWDYSQEDSQAAIDGSASPAGVPGEAIVAGFAHSDDYSIMAGRNSLYRLVGDPLAGGTLNLLSNIIGIVGPNAWCLTPIGELIFLASGGLYVLSAGGDTFPIPLSKENLPNEFLNVDPNNIDISMQYDVQNNAVHVYMTSKSENQRTHWYIDWKNKTFWPQTFDTDYEPTATCQISSTAIEDSGIILGSRDGYLRIFKNTEANDDGTAFDNYAMIGPIPLATEGSVGVIVSMDAILAETSGDIDWELRKSLTPEGSASLEVDVSDSGTWEFGLNASVYPACRGQSFTLTINGSDNGERFVIENVSATIKGAGKRRID